jgi:hypothetical protein
MLFEKLKFIFQNHAFEQVAHELFHLFNINLLLYFESILNLQDNLYHIDKSKLYNWRKI